MVKTAHTALARDTWLYGATLLLMFLELAYSLYWAVSDILIRILPRPHTIFPADMVNFVLTAPLWQEAVYFSGVALIVSSFTLACLRQRAVILTYPLAMLMFSVDWVVAAASGADFLTVAGYISLVYQALVITLLFIALNRKLIR
ncbi:hypothetical protein [Maricaulis parjimensis]|uniref:hypothetical protein n=1 Tax=Maricaulis parjimensis TaxID=144023 RepID=UPI00193A59CE|nr:hypothetical protein [Maricaulis parjimensis]